MNQTVLFSVQLLNKDVLIISVGDAIISLNKPSLGVNEYKSFSSNKSEREGNVSSYRKNDVLQSLGDGQ